MRATIVIDDPYSEPTPEQIKTCKEWFSKTLDEMTKPLGSTGHTVYTYEDSYLVNLCEKKGG